MGSAGGRSGEVPTADFHIYQPPSSLRGWPDDHDTEAALRHLGLLDFARLQLPDGIPRHDLVSDLIDSYHQERRRGYYGCAYVWLTRVNVTRKSFLNATGLQLQPTTELPPNLNPATVTRAALQFMEIWILPQFQGRDVLPSDVSDAMKKVKAGLARSVGWAQLIWDLVRNEILELPTRADKNSYFGLHLLRLIWVKDRYVFGMKDRVEKRIQEELQRQPQVKDQIKDMVNDLIKDMVNNLQRLLQVQQPQVVNNLCNLVGPGDEASAVVPVEQQTMVVQSSQLAIALNDDSRTDKSDSMEPTLAERGEADALKHGVKHGKQQFEQGNQQKRTHNRNRCSVPTGSTISTATSSRNIIGVEREVKRARLENQSTQELLEAEMFIQAVKMLKETLPAETILHTLKDSPASGSPLMCGDAMVKASNK